VTRGVTARTALALGALGIVFGDIGTSPLYTVQTLFNPQDPHPIAATRDSIFGVVSLIFWAVTIIVTATYVLLVMRADNDGEGGIMALITLIRRRGIRGGRRVKLTLALLGVFGAALFFGDSMITPAISVLSAIEGVKVSAPSVSDLVIPITVIIIVILFLLQRLGTGTVGRVFGPVMAFWFFVIGAFGVRGVTHHPEVLKALSPSYAVRFWVDHPGTAFFSLASVVLAVTGAEALYADLGHFGRRPITRAWLVIVFPACILNYMGQGALILGDYANISSPFFLLAPGWAQLPLVFLAAAATVIASQAVITGTFSLVSQASRLGYLPRLRIIHTSAERIGQIYVPWVNWALMIAVVVLVLSFRTSSKLGYAYGMAVTGTITITTLLFFYIARRHWKTPLWILIPGAAFLLTVDLLFFAANLTKFTHGAWLPIAVALVFFTVLTTWQKGRELVTQAREEEEGPLQSFVDKLHAMDPPLLRVPGTAIFLNRADGTTPLAMRATVEHTKVLPESALILALETKPVPHVPPEQRIKVSDLGSRDDGISFVRARLGYLDEPNIPDMIPLIEQAALERPFEPDDLSYFLSTLELARGDHPGMSRWRKDLFLAISKITADAAEDFRLPRDQTVIMGSRMEL
jgi:KUP system potassium uptake protein